MESNTQLLCTISHFLSPDYQKKDETSLHSLLLFPIFVGSLQIAEFGPARFILALVYDHQ